MLRAADPTLGLVSETVLEVVNAHRTESTLREVVEFMARGRTFAGDRSRLVIAIQMVLVGTAPQRHTFQQLVINVGIASGSQEGRVPVHAGEKAVLHRVRRHMSGPAKNRGHAETTLKDCAFFSSERRAATVRPGERLCTIVSGKDDDGVVIKAVVLEILHH